MATHYEYPISAVPHRTPLEPQGPLVTPGVYTVRLTVDGRSETAPLTVKMDPRVDATMADLEALHAAQTAMAASLDALAKADLAARSVSEQLSKLNDSALRAQLASFSDVLKTLLSGTGPKTAKQLPGIDDLNSEATELYGELQQADVAPTAAQVSAAAHVESESQTVLEEWERFKESQLPAINQELRDAGRPGIDLSHRPANIPQRGDED